MKELNEYGNIKTEFDGKRGIIIDTEHPHYGKSGISIGVQNTNAGYGMLFKADEGEEFFVFNGKQVKWI